MKKPEKEAIVIARRIREFLNGYEAYRKSGHATRPHEMAPPIFIMKGIREETLSYDCFNSGSLSG
ncbi:MAG: hypothetical protein LBU32_08470 [Clostridiales bacterium]|jgi:hypothetical protein|nr:hypothetical protein [Clostridiales bacterium]